MTELDSIVPPYESLPVYDDISLRALAPADAPELFALIDSSRDHLSVFLSWVNNTQSVDDSLAFIAKAADKRAKNETLGFGIFVDSKLAGYVSLMHVSDGLIPEIGYWIGKAYAGQGITTKATKAVTAFAFETLGLNKVIIRVVPHNAASNAIPPKVGYAFAGLYDDKDGPHNHWILERQQQHRSMS